jgi:hypothetical protein
MKENCPVCKVHRGHKAGCSELAREVNAPTKSRPSVDPANYTLAKYREFLKAKCNLAADFGIPVEPGDIHPWLKDHQRAGVMWAVRGGRRALFESFGLGKTVQQLEILRLILKQAGGRGLIVAPLGVRQEFQEDAKRIDIEVKFIRSIEEAGATGIYLTNYETVRDGKLDPNKFTAASLDEAGILRGFGGTKTFREFMRLFESVPYRFVATATPDPNEYIELLAYAAFLGIMDVSQAKTRFFKRDSVKADKLTLHPHKEKEFWLWCSSWALFLEYPSDLGYDDTGYALPDLEVIKHEVAVDHSGAQPEKDGQGRMFREASHGVTDAAREKRDTLTERVRRMVEIVRGREKGVFQSLLSEEQSEVQRGGTKQLSERPGTGQAAKPGMETEESRAIPRIATSLLSQESGAGQSQERGMVSGEQTKSQPDDPSKQIEKVRPNAGGLQCDAPESGRALPDLPRQVNQSSGRSQSWDGRSAGDSVPTVQRGVRAIPGQSEDFETGDRIPDQFIVWCDLNAEQRAIDRALDEMGISYSSLYGNQSLDERDAQLEDWRERKTTAFVTKPMMYGSGVNLQQCATAIFIGIGFKFSEFLQAIKRIHRFLQLRKVRIHLIYAESERLILENLMAKWERHRRQSARMSEIIKEFGLSESAMRTALTRQMGCERTEVKTETCRLINNDTIEEIHADSPTAMEANSVHLILTSIPFSTQYEYSPSYNDFGHTDGNEHFFEQMDFLTPQLLRVLKPGRVCAIHVKDRIVPGGITGLGFQTVYPFHCRTIDHFVKHGFGYMGMKTIVTDVVRENNQTYRLGWTEQCKDGSKMGVGMPEYLLIFRKPPTDTTNSYADEPVIKHKPLCVDSETGETGAYDKDNSHQSIVLNSGYSRARWQLDAHGFERSSGNRLLTAEELEGIAHHAIYKKFRAFSKTQVYDYEHHVAIAESLEQKRILPVKFMLLPPQSWHPDVWTDITRMRTLNGAQSAQGKEMHLCLAEGSLVLTKERGYIPIQEVLAGQSVLTHKGRWRTVTIVRETGPSEAVRIRAHGVPGLTLTPDHKLWCRKSTRIREREGAEYRDPEWIEARESLGAYVNLNLPECEPHAIEDCLHWWIVGRWLADGHWESRGSAIISCGAHEVEALLAKLGDRAGGISDTGTAHQIRILDPKGILKATLRGSGAGASGKRFPPEASTLPPHLARPLLEGFLSGDGHYRAKEGRWMVTIVSRALALGVALLAQRVYGAIASVYPGRPERDADIQGRTVHCKREWVICFYPQSEGRRKAPFLLEDGAWKRVRSVEIVDEVKTWNLRVAEDESYTAEGCVVKNCPLQFDIANRVIAQNSMEGETVFDPFGGLMTVPYCAVPLKRKAIGCELSTAYFQDGIHYVKAAEEKVAAPTLFDMTEWTEKLEEEILDEASPIVQNPA